MNEVWKLSIPPKEIKNDSLLVNLWFCPVKITLNNNEEFICTQSWQWVKDNIQDLFIPEDYYIGEEIFVYDLSNFKSRIISRTNIKSTRLEDFKGQMYFR